MEPKTTLITRYAAACMLLCCCACDCPQGKSREESWKFAVSGDSRNCGDVVMPAIAGDVLKHRVAFYWHLGDFRAMYQVDDDMAARYKGTLTPADYQRDAWGDFIDHQIVPFGSLPVYLGIGNHELIGRKQEDFVNFFANWLDSPELHRQRLADGTPSETRTYYHWQKRQVDFISMDNAADEGFDSKQIEWLEGVLQRDKADPSVRTIVVGMHRALPNSFSCGHSMNEDGKGVDSGRKAYRDLLRWSAETGKKVYVLASHSHFYMERIYETPYWKNTAEKDRGVLPGWIVGTAGAVRYGIPEGIPKDIRAETLVSGYLLASVARDGEIQFEFKKVVESDVPKHDRDLFGDKFVEMCFKANKSLGPSTPPASCSDK